MPQRPGRAERLGALGTRFSQQCATMLLTGFGLKAFLPYNVAKGLFQPLFGNEISRKHRREASPATIEAFSPEKV